MSIVCSKITPVQKRTQRVGEFSHMSTEAQWAIRHRRHPPGGTNLLKLFEHWITNECPLKNNGRWKFPF